jgi:hypothetical protein
VFTLVYLHRPDKAIVYLALQTELAEILARNHFVTEGRNPIPTSIYYFALRKPKTVWGLWRQVSHPERAAMIKFLQNNFEDPRWQSAAVKNAYALLGKQRFRKPRLSTA